MSKWHYEYEEEIVGGGADGKYLAYLTDTYDYILNDPNWVFINNAEDERDWILDALEYVVESVNGEYTYVPTPETQLKFEVDDLIVKLEYEDRNLEELRSF